MAVPKYDILIIDSNCSLSNRQFQIFKCSKKCKCARDSFMFVCVPFFFESKTQTKRYINKYINEGERVSFGGGGKKKYLLICDLLVF